MIHSSLGSKVNNIERLIDLWAARYHRRLQFVQAEFNTFEDTISVNGRRMLLARLNEDFIKQSCRRGSIRTSDLYAAYKDSSLGEIAELAKFSIQIYDAIFQSCQAHTPKIINVPNGQSSGSEVHRVLEISGIIPLATALKPLLYEFHARQTIEEHWQTRSFLTTQLSFTNWFLLEALPSTEQILLGAYLDFAEEYVSMPWQGLYEAAMAQLLGSPSLTLVERMLPQITPISVAVYTQWCKSFGDYYNRRGRLDDGGVKRSAVRDFSMFQVYLWCCLLQGSLDAIEQELLELCFQVYRGIGIPWEMTLKGTQLLVKEILSRLDASETALILPYTDGLLNAFDHRA